MFGAVDRHVSPLEIGQILQTETPSYATLGVPGSSQLPEGLAKYGHIRLAEAIGSTLRHRSRFTVIEVHRFVFLFNFNAIRAD
jgi:hypothetical protein